LSLNEEKSLLVGSNRVGKFSDAAAEVEHLGRGRRSGHPHVQRTPDGVDRGSQVHAPIQAGFEWLKRVDFIRQSKWTQVFFRLTEGQ